MHKIAIIVVENFTDLDIVLPYDLLTRVKRPDWSVKLLGSALVHKSMGGMEINMHGRWVEANSADAVLFGSGQGTRAMLEDSSFLESFKLDPERQLICSIDSGALLMAKLGILKGMTATTYPTVADRLRRMDVDVVEESFVSTGNIATAGGCLSSQHLAGWIIERFLGSAERDRILGSILPVGQGCVGL